MDDNPVPPAGMRRLNVRNDAQTALISKLLAPAMRKQSRQIVFVEELPLLALCSFL